jgi:hypothetical protein
MFGIIEAPVIQQKNIRAYGAIERQKGAETAVISAHRNNLMT